MNIENIQRQELFCHNCKGYVQFNIDLSLDGNHVLECPNCKHEHCRVVKDGVITEDRWGNRNHDTTNTMNVSTRTITFTLDSTYNTFRGGASVTTSTLIDSTNMVFNTGTGGNDVYYVIDSMGADFSDSMTTSVDGSDGSDGRNDIAARYIYGSWMDLAGGC